VSRPVEHRTRDATERVDERPLVSRGLHGVSVGHVRTRIDIHHNGYLRAAFAFLVRYDMGNGRPRRVQGQSVSSLHQWNHRVEHNHRKVYLSVLQM